MGIFIAPTIIVTCHICMKSVSQFMFQIKHSKMLNVDGFSNFEIFIKLSQQMLYKCESSLKFFAIFSNIFLIHPSIQSLLEPFNISDDERKQNETFSL